MSDVFETKILARMKIALTNKDKIKKTKQTCYQTSKTN